MHLRTALRIIKNSKDPVAAKNEPYLYNLLGVCLTNLGDYINAEKSFQEGARSDDLNCLANLAVMYLKKGDKNKAKEILGDLNSRTVNG